MHGSKQRRSVMARYTSAIAQVVTIAKDNASETTNSANAALRDVWRAAITATSAKARGNQQGIANLGSANHLETAIASGVTKATAAADTAIHTIRRIHTLVSSKVIISPFLVS